MNTTLVCLIGSLRGGELTWNSLRDNVLEPNRADLALMIGKTSELTDLHKWASYVWTIPERTDAEWGVALDRIAAQLHVQNATAWRGDLGFFEVTKSEAFSISPRVSNVTWMTPTFLGPSKWSATINLVMRWELKHRLIKHSLHRKYKRFIVTRSDQFYGCPLSLPLLDPKYIWVPVRFHQSCSCTLASYGPVGARTCACVCVRVCVCVRARACVCAYIYIYICIYMCVCFVEWGRVGALRWHLCSSC